MQVQDRFLESLLQFRVEALNFQPFGFHEFDIDQDKLAKGIFSLHRASGLMQDGLPFDIPGADSAPPVKALGEYFGPDQKTLDVYLAIPNYRVSGVNLSSPERGLDTRYLAAVTTVRDENSGAAERPIQVARKNFRLLVEGEPMRGAIALRCARVEKTEGGNLQLDPYFVPPLLDFSSSEFLASIARRLIELLTAKCGQLSGLRRQKNQSLAEFTTADIANFWLLYTLNSHFPQLRHLSETKHGHPEEFYSMMVSLASTLTTFSLEIQPGDLPVYDHNELGACFRELDEKLRRLLETVVPSNFVSLQLKPIRPSIYAATIFEDRFLDKATQLYFAIQADMNEGELIDSVPRLVKICSADHIDHLIGNALPGVPLVHRPALPMSIPVKLNHQYFSLSRSGNAWEAIERVRNVAAYIPAGLPNAEAELIVLLPQQ
jgi:type VI secretion system protein ImpJ